MTFSTAATISNPKPFFSFLFFSFLAPSKQSLACTNSVLCNLTKCSLCTSIDKFGHSPSNGSFIDQDMCLRCNRLILVPRQDLSDIWTTSTALPRTEASLQATLEGGALDSTPDPTKTHSFCNHSRECQKHQIATQCTWWWKRWRIQCLEPTETLICAAGDWAANQAPRTVWGLRCSTAQGTLLPLVCK